MKTATVRHLEANMENTINDGGAAYPTHGESHEEQLGMTLRDYFFGQALLGLSSRTFYNPDVHKIPLVQTCWDIADEAIKTRG